MRKRERGRKMCRRKCWLSRISGIIIILSGIRHNQIIISTTLHFLQAKRPENYDVLNKWNSPAAFFVLCYVYKSVCVRKTKTNEWTMWNVVSRSSQDWFALNYSRWVTFSAMFSRTKKNLLYIITENWKISANGAIIRIIIFMRMVACARMRARTCPPNAWKSTPFIHQL